MAEVLQVIGEVLSAGKAPKNSLVSATPRLPFQAVHRMRYLAMKFSKTLVLVFCLCLSLISRPTAGAQTSAKPLVYVSIDVPGSISTVANGINGRGDIVGYYLNVLISSDHHGFILANGAFTTINFPEAPSGTDVFGINDSGSIVGDYFDAQEHGHGFAKVKETFVTIDFPNAAETACIGINSSGDIVGAYTNAAGDQHGFLLRKSSFSTIDVPGAFLTVARAINDEGDIAGFYFDIRGPHGFVLSNGSFRTIDFPGEPSNSLSGIDSAGSVVGGFADRAGFGDGFLLRNGIFRVVAFPGAVASGANGINDSGGIVGNYVDSQFASHGFFAAPK
jgi:uncharacterized membrane protein